MKKIDFTKLNIRFSLDKSAECVERDMTKVVGDAVYVHSSGIAAARLAEKIYDSTCGIELSDEEVTQVVACMESANLINPLIEAVRGL